MVNTLPYQYDEQFLNNQVKITYVSLAFFAVIGFLLAYQHILPVWLIGVIAIVIVAAKLLPNYRKQKRIEYILHTPIPRELWRNQELRALNLSPAQQTIVEDALKDFFILHVLAPKKPLAMPSQMVDKLWHAFILDTQRYQQYCQKAFGKVFHHVPDYQFSDRGRNVEMFTWQMACRLQGIRPANPLTIPRLFAIDKVMAGTLIGSFLWDSYQTQMALMYRQWHAQTFANATDSIGDSLSDIASDYDDSCNVGLTDSGDCSCGGSGSDGGGDSGCGGGCGGGGD